MTVSLVMCKRTISLNVGQPGMTKMELFEKARAKINLRLKVTGRYEDGYHGLDMTNISLALNDGITYTPASSGDFELLLTGEEASELIKEDPAMNLAVRAAKAFQNHFSWPDGGKIHINKNIPAGTGLGGGSADAAAVLRMFFREAYKKGVVSKGDVKTLHLLAAELGADVPFQLEGGYARVRGKGEIVEPLNGDRLNEKSCILVIPDIRCSTPAIYQQYRKLYEVIDPVAAADQNISEISNDLFVAACKIKPQLQQYYNLLSGYSGVRCGFSGSGSAFFLLPERHNFSSFFLEEIQSDASREGLQLIFTSLLANFTRICQI